jgi:hypothetical protein
MLEPTDWRDEARLLRAAGRTPRQIAKMLGRSPAMVEETLREPRMPDTPKPPTPKTIKAAGDRKPRRREGSDEKPDNDGAKPLGASQAKLAAPHVPRTPRVILDRAVLRAAAPAFARNEIDRTELMRRITR